jgi:MoCo/4Fe-4S cofactor protein with predicted Tat translocation signal
MEHAKYWKSLGELAQDDAWRERIEAFVRDRHPSQMPSLADPLERRTFLQLMGASFALAGLSACTRQPDETIHPYAKSPESSLPGKPRFFATCMPWASGAIGCLVESHEGRPTKIEGNPDHPASLGAADALTQASVLGLYDPERSKVVTRDGRISTYDSFLGALRTALDAQEASQGAGLRLLTETVTSPTLAAQLRGLLARYPKARWHQYEPVNRDRARAGTVKAFGADLSPRHDLSRADVIVSFDADFLAGPAGVRLARAFAARRRDPAGMNRLYVAEASPTITGAMADHRLALKPSQIERAARALARETAGLRTPQETETGDPEVDAWLRALVTDLQLHRGGCVVMAGESASPIVHALACDLNVRLGAVGSTVTYGEPVDCEPVDQGESLRALVEDLRAGGVELLAILGGNPVHGAPADVEFAAALRKAPLRVHLGLYEDETAELCQWHLPQTHFLEAWSDARAFDGTLGIVQPLIAPLYDGHSIHEIVAAFAGQAGAKGYDLVREHWKIELAGAQDFERAWRQTLHDGCLAGSPVARDVQRQVFMVDEVSEEPAARGALELALRADSNVWDGRFANNGWLQELPRPLSTLTWDNALLLAPTTAAQLGVSSGDVVRLEHGGRALEVAVLVQPGQALGCGALSFGYGRRRAGALGTGIGANAFALRLAGQPWNLARVALERTGSRHAFAITQEHHDLQGRDLLRESTPGELAARQMDEVDGAEAPDSGVGRGSHPPPSLYPDVAYPGAAWGLVVDLSSCIGCNACVVACQAENNVPIVGADQVRRGREMHWIRIDRYFSGAPDAPKLRFQPVMCMHCETAPCELVCPVGATVHSPEGLNEMVYNRCVGTKYCSNNCPYKVRRFNYYLYSDLKTPTIKMQKNPDVTVRTRGVMEKCTYCVQRIESARIQARKEDRRIRDGEIVPACQQTCPAQALTFGDVNDPQSAVSKLRKLPQHYGLLTELNTRPRTTYLARLTNPSGEPGGGLGGERAR